MDIQQEREILKAINYFSSFEFNQKYELFEKTLISEYKKYNKKSNMLLFFDSFKPPKACDINKYMELVFLQKPYILDKSKEYYRSRRILNSDEFDKLQVAGNRLLGFNAHESGAPHAKYVKAAGRCNPKGVPYLYISGDKYTALSEIDPYNGEKISIAKCRVKKSIKDNIKLIDLVFSGREYPKKVNDDVINATYLRDIVFRFLLPCNSNPEEQYLPMQYISHLIMKKGYAGIAYESQKSHEGRNYVLFDTHHDRCIVEFDDDSELIICSGIEYVFQNITKANESNPATKNPFKHLETYEIEQIHDDLLHKHMQRFATKELRKKTRS